jgi:hypothetical protein
VQASQQACLIDERRMSITSFACDIIDRVSKAALKKQRFFEALSEINLSLEEKGDGR